MNHFHAAGGTGFLFGELMRGGYLHPDANTVWGESFIDYCVEPKLKGGNLHWDKTPTKSVDQSVLSCIEKPFEHEDILSDYLEIIKNITLNLLFYVAKLHRKSCLCIVKLA